MTNSFICLELDEAVDAVGVSAEILQTYQRHSVAFRVSHSKSHSGVGG